MKFESHALVGITTSGNCIGILLLLLSFGNLSVLRAQTQLPPAALTEAYQQTILSALRGLVDGHLLQVSNTLNVLAHTAEVQTAKWEQMQNLLRSAIPPQLSQVLWFVRPDGAYFSSDRGRVEQNLKDRPYFAKLMSGQPVFAELVVSKSTGKKSIIIALPVQRQGRVLGGVGASIFSDDLSRVLANTLNVPQGTVFYGLATNGLTAFHIDPRLDFVDPRQQQSESLKQEVERMLSQQAGDATYEYAGTMRHVIFDTSPATGWRIVFGRILSPALPPTGRK